MIERRHHPDLHPTPGYHHATVVHSGRLVLLAGQMPVDHTGTGLVGAGDLDRQIDVTVENCLGALGLADAEPQDVARSVVYVRSDDPVVLAYTWQRIAASELGAGLTSASTLVGVSALGFPGQLVEIELTAVVWPSAL